MKQNSKKKTKRKTSSKKSYTGITVVDKYINDLGVRIPASKELLMQVDIIKKEFDKKLIEVNSDLYDKYIKIGGLFFNQVFPFQCFALAMSLCTFYKGTSRPRWNKVLVIKGRGNGKDSDIAWYSVNLTSTYHGVKRYDVDIIANSIEQALRPLEDIDFMVQEKNKKKLLKMTGESVFSYKTSSSINARSSDANMALGARSGAVIFNEVHQYQNYSKINTLVTGLGKIDDPRVFYFTTNGEKRGAVLDDMLDTAVDVLNGIKNDRRTLYLIYKLDSIEEIDNRKLWVKANPLMPYRSALSDEIEDEYELWKRSPQNFPGFPQMRMNLPIASEDQEVVSWDIIQKTQQEYNYDDLDGMDCVLGIDASKTTDWTAVNFLFYDSDLDKYICINHAFICGKNRDLPGIKAPYQEWCNNGLGTIIDEKEVAPDYVVKWCMDLANDHNYNIVSVVVDNFKKALFGSEFENYGFSKDLGNLEVIRPSQIAEVVPIIERAFLNERLIWKDNPMLRWATNNTKVIAWKRTKTTGDNDLGNQLYAKINPRFRKTDPFMAFVHSMVRREDIEGEYADYDDLTMRGF